MSQTSVILSSQIFFKEKTTCHHLDCNCLPLPLPMAEVSDDEFSVWTVIPDCSEHPVYHILLYFLDLCDVRES